MLLYLEPEKMVQLNEVLKKLERFMPEGEAQEAALHLIRKDLFDLVYPLSPLSRTRKLAREILNFTEEYMPSDRKAIMGLISAVRDIYKIRETGEFVHIAGRTTTNV